MQPTPKSETIHRSTTMRMKEFFALLLAAGMATHAIAADIDGLILDLAGKDEKARAVARQLLPREGLAAVPELLPLLRNDEALIWWPAHAVLRDIFNNLVTPGQSKEREDATAQTLAFLAPAETTAVKLRVLRLLPIIVGRGTDLTPLAALLGDAELRERTREILGEIGTPEAVKVLTAALDNADPEFQVALLNTFVHLKKRDALAAVRPLLKSESPEVRAAAARAVSWTGQSGYVSALRNVFSESTPETRFDAGDALLRLYGSIALAGGNYETVIKGYRELLAKAEHPVIEAGALVGLGTYGDESVIPEIIAAASGAHAATLQGPALQALAAQNGRAATNTLLAAYERADNEMKALLLQMFGRKQDAAYLPALTTALDAPEPTLRAAGVAGLRELGSAEAAATLGAYAQRATAEDRAVAVAALEHVTTSLVQAGNAEAAGRAYLALYRAAGDDTQRNAAIEGMKRYPVPESFEVLINDLDLSQLAGMPVKNLAALHKALADAGRTDDAKKAEGILSSQLTSTGNVSQLIDYVRANGTADQWVGRLGAISKWQIVGAFPFDMKAGFVSTNVGEPNIDLAAKYTTKAGEAGWIAHGGDPLNGLTDLSGPFGMLDKACAYAVAKINVAEAGAATLRCGSDDGIKAWVNGAPVHENNVDRGFALDSDQAPITLNAGENTILVQITQGGGGWNFGVRLTLPDGAPLLFTQP